MDLGTKSEPLGEPVAAEEPKVRYPSFTIRDEKVDALKAESGHDCAVDDFYTATVRLRVSAVSDDDMGKRVELEVVELDDFEPEDGGETDEDEPAKGEKKPSKALRYS